MKVYVFQILIFQIILTKLTLITGYFYPEDTAIGLYNTQLAEYLTAKGYQVQVLTGFPCYPQWRIDDNYSDKPVYYQETFNKIRILRYKQYVPSKPTFLNRILLLADYSVGTLINLFKIKDCDVVINVIPHSSTMLLGWILKTRTKAKLWNHIQDFEFDAVYETGIITNSNFIRSGLFKALFKIETILLNKATINSTISHHMLNKLKRKSNRPTFYFPNWIDLSQIDPLKHSKQHPFFKSNGFKILYSGNIGDKQDWEFFLEFAEKLGNQNIEIVVVGDGAKKSWLVERIATLNHVNYHPPVAYNQLSSLLCSADLHILFQKNSVVDSVMPSKLLGMMASAKPSLVTGSDFSEVKTVIKLSKGGFYISSDDKISIAYLKIQELISQPDVALKMGINARNYVTEKFSSSSILSHFEAKLNEVVSS